jgi:hypothetical protein
MLPFNQKREEEVPMPKANSKPGPKIGEKRVYGKRRDYHILLEEKAKEDDAMSLAEAFEQEAKKHGGIIAYAAMIIAERPEIRALLSESEEENARAQ